MPQVKGGQKGKGGGKQGGKGQAGKKPAPGRDAVVKQTTDASSIIMGIFLLIAVLVGTAAWMGRSMSVIENQFNALSDGFVRTIGLSIDTIRVYHASPEQEARIRKALQIGLGDNMFRADPHRLRKRLAEVPGLGEIQVHRFWPGQISVFVTPLEASVLFWDGQQYVAMNPAGNIVPDVEIAKVDFPVVTGAGAVEASPDLLADLQSFPIVSSKLRYADRVGERRWDLVMMTNVRVLLPSGDDRFDALKRLAGLQRETGLLDRRVERIDLRDPDRVYTRRGQLNAAMSSIESKG